jgi:TolA-binding protein
MHRKLSLLLLLFFFLVAAAGFASAQTIHLPAGVAQGAGMGDTPVTTSGDEVQKKQAEAANAQRQGEIRRDTEKMKQLTEELNDYLQKSGQGVISVDALKKAEQIEKLAHSVKSKMKQSF